MASDIVDLSEITFCQRNNDAPNAEITQNLEMLFGLRHPAVVCRDHQEREIDRPNAGDHIADEIFVARNIDNTDRKS